MGRLGIVLVALLVLTGLGVVASLWAAGGGGPSASAPATVAPTATPEAVYTYPTAEDVGACFDPIADREDGSLLAIRILPCEEPHLGEVLGIGEIDARPDEPFPGDSAVQADGEAICFDIFEAYVGVPYHRSRVGMAVYSPVRETWGAGDRAVWCMAEAPPSRPYTLSVRDLGN